MSRGGRTENRVAVALAGVVACLASAAVFYYGGDLRGGPSAAVAACSLALLGIAASREIEPR